MKLERSAGLVVFRPASSGGAREYLLVRSRRHGAWGFPKGHLHPGESEEDAARRETAEEAGLSGPELVPGFREVLRYPLRDGSGLKEAVYLLARAPAGGELLGAADDETAEVRWAELEPALELITFENARGLLRVAAAFLDNNVV